MAWRVNREYWSIGGNAMKLTVDLDFEVDEWGATLEQLIEDQVKHAVGYEVKQIVKSAVKEHAKGITSAIKTALGKRPNPKMIQEAAEAALLSVWSKK
jgi:hypothetical protein